MALETSGGLNCFLPFVCTICLLVPSIDCFQVRSVHTEKEDNRPNIVWVLADDLHYEPAFFEKMPNLRRLKNEGLEFPNHVAPNPLCGPSRASILTGRLPHNTGYENNMVYEDERAAGFVYLQDHTVGKWLTDAGYYTAFLGKYVNGFEGKKENTPTGWRYFGGFTGRYDLIKFRRLGGTYSYYNASQWDLYYDETGTNLEERDNSDYPINIWEGVHQADFLASQTLEHVKRGLDMGRPFFVFTNPAMVHHGYCRGPFDDINDFAVDDPWREEYELGIGISPCVKKEKTLSLMTDKLGDWKLHERTPAYNRTAVGLRAFGQDCCSAGNAERQRLGAQNRTGSLMDLDDMLGVIIDGLSDLGVLENTYVFFTSDNGFHLGEHKYFFGKSLPYDHDVRVPMVVRIPQKAYTGLRNHPTSHIDITRTIVDIAQATSAVTPSLEDLEGESLMNAFKDEDLADWRRISFSESMEGAGRTWRNARFIGKDGKVHWTMNVWCSGFVELFHHGDVDQMINILDPEAGSSANEIGQEIVREWMPVINGMGKCSGATCLWKNVPQETESDLKTCSEQKSKQCKQTCHGMEGDWSSRCALPDCEGCFDCPGKIVAPNYCVDANCHLPECLTSANCKG